MPEEYKEYADKAESALEAASELKKKKDEYQQQMFVTAITPLWT